MTKAQVTKLTHFKWLNLFKTERVNDKGNIKTWFFASRNKKPSKDTSPDAVVIVPIVKTKEGNKVAVIKEYREPLFDYEWGFAAGLIDKGDSIEDAVRRELKEETGLDLINIISQSAPVYSSAGLTDEYCIMVFVEASGELSTEYQFDTEEIEPFLMSAKEVEDLLSSDNKLGAKSWGVLYYFSKTGNIV